MKRAILLFTAFILFISSYSQPLVWHNYYAKDAGYGLVDVGNYIYSIRTNQLIKFQKSTGYFSYSTIPNDILPCSSDHDSLATMFVGLVADNHANLWLITTYYNNVTWGDSVGHFYKYDGNSWISFSPTLVAAGYTPAPSPVFDRSGNMWFVDSSRLVKYDGNVFTRWDSTDFPLLKFTSQYDRFIIDTAGNFWDPINGYGLLKFDGQNFTLYDSTVFHKDRNGYLNVTDVFCNQRDNKIYAQRESLIDTTYFIFDGASWSTLYIDTAITSPNYLVQNIFWDNNNNTYYSLVKGLLKYDGTSYTLLTNLPGQAVTNNYVNPIDLDSAGTLWVLANGVFCGFDGSAFTIHSDPKAVLPGNNMLPSILDNNGHPWFGFFRADGLTTFDGNAFSTIPVGGPITALVKDSSGIIYIGSHGPNFIRSYNPSTGIVKNYPYPAGGTSTDPVMGLTIDANGIVWGVQGVDVSYNGLMKLQNDTVINVPNTFAGGLQGYYSSIAADVNGNIWIGTHSDPSFQVGPYSSGLLKFDGTSFTNYDNSNSGLPENEVETITFGPSGKLWIATNSKGCVVYDGSTWMVYDTTNTSLPTNHIENFFFKNGKTLIASRKGFTIFDGTNWNTFTIDNSGLVNGDVESVLLDDNCNVWAATECGLSRLVGTCTGDNIIYGTVTEHSRAIVPNVDVYLMKLDAINNKLVPIDNTLTDAAGNYQFATRDPDVYVYALPNNAQLASMLPGYNDTALVQQQSPIIHITGGITQRNIVCHKALVNVGNLSVSGVLMAASGGKAVDYRLYLMLNDEPVATSVTGIDGHFSFNNIAAGTYTIWIDKMGVDNGLGPVVNIIANDTVTAVLYDSFLAILNVGIAQLTTAKSLDIFPNPSHGRINCTVQSDVSETALMSVYDVNGTVVHEDKVSNGTQTIDLSSLPNGVYIVQVVSSFATQQERLVIVK